MRTSCRLGEWRRGVLWGDDELFFGVGLRWVFFVAHGVLLSWSPGSRVSRLLQLWCTGLVAPWHV